MEEFDECAEEEFQSSAVIFLLISLPFSNYQQKEVSQKRGEQKITERQNINLDWSPLFGALKMDFESSSCLPTIRKEKNKRGEVPRES